MWITLGQRKYTGSLLFFGMVYTTCHMEWKNGRGTEPPRVADEILIPRGQATLIGQAVSLVLSSNDISPHKRGIIDIDEEKVVFESVIKSTTNFPYGSIVFYKPLKKDFSFTDLPDPDKYLSSYRSPAFYDREELLEETGAIVFGMTYVSNQDQVRRIYGEYRDRVEGITYSFRLRETALAANQWNVFDCVLISSDKSRWPVIQENDEDRDEAIASSQDHVRKFASGFALLAA